MGKWLADSTSTTPNGHTGFLGQGVKLEGTLDLGRPFRIDGEVKGPVRCKDHLVLGENAQVEGAIEAAVVSVAGRISGSVLGTDRVEILPGGVVEGEVYTPSLVMEAGGVLEGYCHVCADAGVAERAPSRQARIERSARPARSAG